MRGNAKALGASLAGVGALVALLLTIARKGPMTVLVLALVAAVLILVLSAVTALLGKKDGKDVQSRDRDP
ncbi:MAG: hypothetical protein HYY16_08555 [Planctomycetes bacterium]|nr:hypothetical protein [Planctomycetota bacterium]